MRKKKHFDRTSTSSAEIMTSRFDTLQRSLLNQLGKIAADRIFYFFGLIFLTALWLNLDYGPSQFHFFDWLFSGESRSLAETIIWNIRLPRAIMCCLIGMSLAAAGVLSQGLFRNPLASPSVIGTSSGGVLAAVLTIYLGFGNLFYLIPLAGFVGALTSTILVLYLTQRSLGFSIDRVLLTGFSLNTLVGALTSFILSLSLENYEKAPMILNWMMGSFSGKGWEHIGAAIVPLGIGLIMAKHIAYRLNILTLGNDIAQSLGVSWHKIRILAIIAIALLVGASVSLVGLLPFLGLIVPHITRRLVGPEHRRLLFGSVINGMSLALLADFLARQVWQPRELQVGVLISLVGSPLFLWLLWRRQDQQ
ncbi:MAG: FecCD family ABC transporter permease [Oligoflexus sp.]